MKRLTIGVLCLVAGLGAWILFRAHSIQAPPLTVTEQPPSPAVLEEGRYVFRIAGCAGCHTDESNGAGLAGGRAFATPFGTFFSPNISPHATDGIGRWTLPQFARALREGIGPRGEHYYPVFPYPSYTWMRDEDIVALYAYLMQQPPVPGAARPHELPWHMRFRIANWVWKLLYFEPGPLQNDAGRSASWNRGAYIVKALAHCGECHTPRNRLGAMARGRALAGTPRGPDGEEVPNITPDPETGIGDWSRSELALYLVTGELGEDAYSSATGAMADVIEDGLQHLRDDDLDAIVEYVFALPPRRNDELEAQ